jgi:hypothetical protein
VDYHKYKELISDDIVTCVDSMGVQPILFFGSGMSQRYIGTPSWDGLLDKLSQDCPKITKSLAYYKQRHSNNLIAVGSEFSELIREWAWETRPESYFPDHLFAIDQPADIYIKYVVSMVFKDSTETTIALNKKSEYKEEIESLKNINPYSIITTNYDDFLEKIFSDYCSVIGQEILKINYANVGEIFKIHGCYSNPSSIVLTQHDYNEFLVKKKYLSAKLLTYFAEHPLILLGYSAQDPNIRALLSDIDEILSPDHKLIPNIYLVEWNRNAEDSGDHALEKLIPIERDKSIRVKSITASCFKWIYNSLSSNNSIERISPKILRSLLSRTYKLVRNDIPKRTIEVDFKVLENAVSNDEEFSKLYGITTIDNPSDINANYPYTLTQVASKLGYSYWHNANLLIKKIEAESGILIKNSDNKYHIAIKMGKESLTHKYSQACVVLLEKVRDFQPYHCDI